MLKNVSSTKVPYRTLLYATFTNPQQAKRRESWFLAHSGTVADNSYLGVGSLGSSVTFAFPCPTSSAYLI